MPENKHIEYKQQATPELEKEVVAFLNSNEGGVVYMPNKAPNKTSNMTPNKLSNKLRRITIFSKFKKNLAQ